MPAPKSSAYYSVARTDLVPYLPRPLGRVLDVGCATGLTGQLLLPDHPECLVGVEINPEAAEIARRTYDEVVVGSAETALAELSGTFDTILCYDVLEHLVDPWAVLEQLGRLSPLGGRLHISVPNARHLSLMLDVMVRGTFDYQAWGGHRDDTHLRWFTPRDIESAVRDAGYEVRSRSHPTSRTQRLFGAITRGRSNEFLVWQWQVLAVRAGPAAAS